MLPRNNQAQIRRVMRRFGLDMGTYVTITANSGTHSIGEIVTSAAVESATHGCGPEHPAYADLPDAFRTLLAACRDQICVRLPGRREPSAGRP